MGITPSNITSEWGAASPPAPTKNTSTSHGAAPAGVLEYSATSCRFPEKYTLRILVPVNFADLHKREQATLARFAHASLDRLLDAASKGLDDG